MALRPLGWWLFPAGAFVGLLVVALRSRGGHLDRSAASRLATAAVVLAISALANFAFSLALRAIADPRSAFAWLALYLTAMASLLLLAAGGAAWRSHRLYVEHAVRITMTPEQERVRR